MDLRQHSASLRTININKDQAFAWCPQVHGGFFLFVCFTSLCTSVLLIRIAPLVSEATGSQCCIL